MAIIENNIGQLLLNLTGASAPIKIIAFFCAWAVLWLPIAIPTAIALKWNPQKPLSPNQKLPLLASLYLIAPPLIWGFATLQKFPFSDYGLDWKPSLFISIALGFSIGVLGLIILFGVQFALGFIKWRFADTSEQSQSLLSITVPILLIGLGVSFTEELIFRGFLVTQLQQDYSLWLTAAISSLIFAILHLIWEVRETAPQLPGLWMMGMVLVLARLSDRGNLGIAIGLHAAWIWGIATFDTAQLITYTGKAPEWITGLNAKPLAGVVGILLLFGTAAILSFIKR